MDLQAQDQLDGTLQNLTEELVSLKGQIERQAFFFEEVLGRLSSLPHAIGLLRSEGILHPSRPKHFIASSAPDPKLLRAIIRQRQRRAKLFPDTEFADPAWEMLLDLKAAEGELKRVSISSLCIASGVAPTTALRWIGHMINAGLLARHEDEEDRRRVYICLTAPAAAAMVKYFKEADEAVELFA
jgi:DNA-binding MarR family transcriptional regulator